MDKWADYVVIAVRFKEDRIHIEKVKVKEDEGDTVGAVQIFLREEVVNLIESGKKFVTAYKKEGKWKKGDDVGIVEINHKKFIRTDGNSIEEDNLGDLPKF